MRIAKEAQVRKDEILDVAQKLFLEKGYAKTTVEDILKKIGIAKGTLYYHFKSKEEILSVIVDRQIENAEKSLIQIEQNQEESAIEKLVQVVQLLSQSKQIVDNIREKENYEFHQKSFTQSLLCFTPIMTKIVEQGIKEKLFSTKYPKETVELLFCSSELFDPGLFAWNDKELAIKKSAFYLMLENTLGISKKAKKELHNLVGAE